ncbi:MAG: hypothetical protein LBU51_05680 [Bacteroidales bacterium]|jgi:hypothetical protein|nr:hypothetical protein [Bacteroidales bacterium]
MKKSAILGCLHSKRENSFAVFECLALRNFYEFLTILGLFFSKKVYTHTYILYIYLRTLYGKIYFQAIIYYFLTKIVAIIYHVKKPNISGLSVRIISTLRVFVSADRRRLQEELFLVVSASKIKVKS